MQSIESFETKTSRAEFSCPKIIIYMPVQSSEFAGERHRTGKNSAKRLGLKILEALNPKILSSFIIDLIIS
jgi:hypothetical protein